MTLRLPSMSWLAIAFFALCVTPMAAISLWGLLFLLLPALAALYLMRTATFVDGTGIRARGLVRSVHMPWAEVAALRGNGGLVIAELTDGSTVALPASRGVAPADIAAVGGEVTTATADSVDDEPS